MEAAFRTEQRQFVDLILTQDEAMYLLALLCAAREVDFFCHSNLNKLGVELMYILSNAIEKGEQ